MHRLVPSSGEHCHPESKITTDILQRGDVPGRGTSAIAILSEGVNESVQLRRVSPFSSPQGYPRGSLHVDDQDQSVFGGVVKRLVQLAVVENDYLTFHVAPNL